MILRLSLQQSLHEKQGKILRVSEIQDDNLILVGEGTRFTLLSLSTQNEWSRVIARSDECSSLSMPQMPLPLLVGAVLALDEGDVVPLEHDPERC